MADNSIFENYKIITEHKKSRYALLEENNTGKLVIADLVSFKIIYEIKSKKCKHLYVRPKDLFINVPKVCHLENKKTEAMVIFLREYSKSSLSGILLFENNTLCVFNSLEDSMIRVKNINKAVVLIYYGLFQEENYVYSEYNVKVRYLNNSGEFQELLIDVSNKFEVMNKGNGTIVRLLTSFKPKNSWYFSGKTWTNVEEILVREIDVLNIPSISESLALNFEKNTGASNIFLALNYRFLL